MLNGDIAARAIRTAHHHLSGRLDSHVRIAAHLLVHGHAPRIRDAAEDAREAASLRGAL